MYQFARAERLLAYGIAGVAGFVDAAGFLAADRYFVSFMSGNTTRFGVELAGGTRAALVAGSLLVGFVIGVALGALVSERAATRPKSSVLALSCGLLVLAAAGKAMGSTPAFLAGSVLAMGAINNVFRKDGGVALGVTYMTGALVRIGEGLAGWLSGSGRGRRGTLPSMLLWASLASGGLLGALATGLASPWVPWGSAVLLLGLYASARRLENRAP
jgi:uncharacterized membrane protein YoaK (UPF0700 family)